ncbi:restriction endonuclease subunit S [Rothia nasimurium]|uniref:restriction endonuclease subunit S n=1 Tax=Rothia nasimurium TaxID=85336 RepID=UPI001F0180FF|nr:restriction endonuclease subunit S [Rothia nasimurium]
MSETRTVRLGSLIKPAGKRAGENSELPVYSVTKHQGFVPSLEYFKKQVFSRETKSYKVVEQGQFAYATIHLDEGSIGIAPEKCIISPMYTVFEVASEEVIPEYLLLYLKGPRAMATYPLLGQGAIERRMAISLKSLSTLEIPLPPLEHQEQEVKSFNLQTTITKKRERQQELYTELERSLFISIFGNPETWANKFEMTTIGDLAKSTQYGTSAKAGATGEYPVLRMGNITDDGKIDLSDLKYMDLSPEEVEKYTVRKGDLLFNRTNSKEKVGKAAVVLTDEKLAYAGYLVRVRFKNPDHAHFVAAFLNSDYGRKLRRKLAKTAVNQANINAKELTKIPIIEPENAKIINFNNFFTL